MLDNNVVVQLVQQYSVKDLELAYRMYPKSTGTLYYKKDLCHEKYVKILFDYYSTLQPIIHKQG